MSKLSEPMLSRHQIVWKEGRDAARQKKTRKDNPYDSGTPDDRSWTEGFKARRDV